MKVWSYTSLSSCNSIQSVKSSTQTQSPSLYILQMDKLLKLRHSGTHPTHVCSLQFHQTPFLLFCSVERKWKPTEKQISVFVLPSRSRVCTWEARSCHTENKFQFTAVCFFSTGQDTNGADLCMCVRVVKTSDIVTHLYWLFHTPVFLVENADGEETQESFKLITRRERERDVTQIQKTLGQF